MFRCYKYVGMVVVLVLVPANQIIAQNTIRGASVKAVSRGTDVPYVVGPFDGRSGETRRRLLAAHGGSEKTETAVALALQWLANHQLPDGSWSFNHTVALSCRGQCANPGSLNNAPNAATAMALLPFLGAGQTQQAGKYKRTVRRGLDYLVRNMKSTQRGATLSESGGTMYSHGLAAIALAEAYAMTQDESLLKPAQAVVDFTCDAQDPVGGGWRYLPRQAGDTSVTGWQLMALENGRQAYLIVPPVVMQKASRFFDRVQDNDGTTYGYTRPGAGHATTAIGLLCRMYLGWDRDTPALKKGVETVNSWGLSTEGNMYYNYYATQVAYHWGGDTWKEWNSQMCDWLLPSQVQEGHEAGSWFFASKDPGASRGGRLYVTSMATMMLETYYRHMPLLRKQPE